MNRDIIINEEVLDRKIELETVSNQEEQLDYKEEYLKPDKENKVNLELSLMNLFECDNELYLELDDYDKVKHIIKQYYADMVPDSERFEVKHSDKINLINDTIFMKVTREEVEFIKKFLISFNLMKLIRNNSNIYNEEKNINSSNSNDYVSKVNEYNDYIYNLKQYSDSQAIINNLDNDDNNYNRKM